MFEKHSLACSNLVGNFGAQAELIIRYGYFAGPGFEQENTAPASICSDFICYAEEY